MSDVARLWRRIEEAKNHLGGGDAAQIERIQDIGGQVDRIRAGLAQRTRDLERHREEVATLRHENEQLRRMLHRLLLAIEQRDLGPLRDLVADLEGKVTALVPLASGMPGDGRPALRRAAKPAPAGPPKARASTPSESDSLWLQEIMERARELSGDDDAAPRVHTSAAPAQGALS